MGFEAYVFLKVKDEPELEHDIMLLSVLGLTADGGLRPAERLPGELHLLSQHLQHPQPLHLHRGGHLTMGGEDKMKN